MGSTDEEVRLALEECKQIATDGECNRPNFDNEKMFGDNLQTIIHPYWIDRYEITNAQYAQFLNEIEYSTLEEQQYLGKSTVTTQINFSESGWQPVTQYQSYPIFNVTWVGAKAFCKWRGKDYDLPTELQWEYAARGKDRWIYPWGNTFEGTKTNHCDFGCANAPWTSGFTLEHPENNDNFAQTAPVRSYEGGESWVGARNMSGNVWEWTNSMDYDYPYSGSFENDEMIHRDRIRRGGGYTGVSVNLRTSTRRAGPTDYSSAITGFRCVRNLSSDDLR